MEAWRQQNSMKIMTSNNSERKNPNKMKWNGNRMEAHFIFIYLETPCWTHVSLIVYYFFLYCRWYYDTITREQDSKKDIWQAKKRGHDNKHGNDAESGGDSSVDHARPEYFGRTGGSCPKTGKLQDIYFR